MIEDWINQEIQVRSNYKLQGFTTVAKFRGKTYTNHQDFQNDITIIARSTCNESFIQGQKNKIPRNNDVKNVL